MHNVVGSPVPGKKHIDSRTLLEFDLIRHHSHMVGRFVKRCHSAGHAGKVMLTILAMQATTWQKHGRSTEL